MVDIQANLDYANEINAWLLDLADSAIRREHFEDAMKYTYVTGGMLALQNRDLVSIRIEENLRFVAGQPDRFHVLVDDDAGRREARQRSGLRAVADH